MSAGNVNNRTELIAAALNLAQRGIPCFPVGQDKKPLVRWKDAATTDQDQIRTWWTQWPDAMVAIPTGERSGTFVIDLDVDRATGEFVGEVSIETAGLTAALAGAPCVLTPSGGRHFYFKFPGEGFRNTAGKIGPGIDTRGEGGYVVGPGSVNSIGAYTSVEPIDWIALPELPRGLREALQGPGKPAETQVSKRQYSAWAEAAMREELARVQEAPEGTRNDALNKAAFSLGQIVAGGGLVEDDVRARLLATALNVRLTEAESHATINSGITAGAQEPRRAKLAQAGVTKPERVESTEQDDARPPEYSDDGLATRFAQLHQHDLRYVAAWACWFIWSGSKWEKDKTFATTDMVRAICRNASSESNKPRVKNSLASAKTVAAVEHLAKSDRLIAATVNQWDINFDIINTPWGRE